VEKLHSFTMTSLIVGLVVILPATIPVTVFLWLYTVITNRVTSLSAFSRMFSEYNELIANVIDISLVIVACFLVGVLVHIRPGEFLSRLIENRVLKAVPNMFHDQVERAAGFRQAGWVFVLVRGDGTGLRQR
jgi:uncharacterized membrane protein